MSIFRRRRLLVALAIAVAGLIAALTGSWVLAGSLARPAPAVVGAPPSEFRATAVRIPSPSGSTLAGWLARGEPGNGAVLLLHGVRANRTSMLSRGSALHRAGYTVLLVDLQGHGESAGDWITFGARESLDARAALAHLRVTVPGERVGALGVSLGGASLILGTAELAANAADAVVLEAVYPTIEEAVADRLRIRLGALGPPLAPLLTWQLRPRIGIPPDELRPISRIGKLQVPLLMIAGAADRHTTLSESRRLFAAAPEPRELWVLEGASHQDLHAFARIEYERRLLEFFGRHLRPAG